MNYKQDYRVEGFLLKNFINLNTLESETIRQWRNHQNIRKWMYTDHIISKEEHIGFLHSLNDNNKRFYWLVIAEDEKPVGVIDFYDIDKLNRHAYYGHYANPYDPIPGAGRILDKVSIALAFDIFHFHTLKCEVIETNKQIVNLHKKMGLKEEGRLVDFVYKEGLYIDVIVMGITNNKDTI